MINQILFVLVAAASAAAAAPHCIDYRDYPHQIAYAATDADGIAVDHDHAFVVGLFSLRVYDVADPEHPRQTDHLGMPFGASAVAVAGDHAYVVNGFYDSTELLLVVIDIADPANIRQVASLDLPARARDVAVMGGYAYLACSDAGLVIVDVTQPVMPHVVGQVALGWASGVAVDGGLGFVAADDQLHVVDVSDPAHPQAFGSVAIPGGAVAVAVADQYAYVGGPDGLHVVRCADPAQPVLTGSVATDGTVARVAIAGVHAFAATGARGLQVVDVADPTAPHITCTIDTARSAQDVAVVGTTVYLACNDYAYVPLPGCGLFVIDAANPVRPATIGALDLGASAGDLAVAGSTAYVLTAGEPPFPSALQVVDLTEPETPRVVGMLGLPAASMLAVTPPYVVLGTNSPALLVIDVTDPAQPQYAGAVQLSDQPNAIAAAGPYAYVGVGVYITGAIHMVDLADPYQPEIAYTTPFGCTNAMTVAGSCLAVAGLTRLISPIYVFTVYHITQPPELYGGGSLLMTDRMVYRMAAADHRVFLTSSASDPYGYWSWPLLEVADIADPQVPQFLPGTFLPSWSAAIAATNSVVYVGGGDDAEHGSLHVYAVDDVAGPRLLGGMCLSGELTGIALAGDVVVGLRAPGTLGTLPTQRELPTAVAEPIPRPRPADLALAVQPNPCNPRATISFRLAQPGWVEVGVFGLDGRRVAVVAARPFAAGEQALAWDGRDADGRQVAAGVYCARVVTATATAVRKLVVVR